MVLRCEMSCKEPHRGQCHLAGREHVEDHRESLAGPGGRDAIRGGIFGEPKSLGAIRVERAVALCGVNGGTRIERGQVGHELGEGCSLLLGKRAQAREEVMIGKGGGSGKGVRIQVLCVSRPFSRSRWAPQRAQEQRSRVESSAHDDCGGDVGWSGERSVQRSASRTAACRHGSSIAKARSETSGARKKVRRDQRGPDVVRDGTVVASTSAPSPPDASPARCPSA
jgi:hypothetical protein